MNLASLSPRVTLSRLQTSPQPQNSSHTSSESITQNLFAASNPIQTVEQTSAEHKLLNNLMLDAARAGSLKKVQAAVELGANINAVDNNGNTVLMLALRGGFKETAKYLIPLISLEAINSINNTNNSALSLSIMAKFDDLARLLMPLTTSPTVFNAVDNNGQTPLSLAISLEFGYLVNMLIPLTTSSTAFNAVNDNGETPLSLALTKKLDRSLAYTLLPLTTSPEAINAINKGTGKTVLMLAASEEKPDIAIELIKKGFTAFNSVDNNGETALSIAINKKFEDLALMLIPLTTSSMTINAANIKTGNTALMIAITKKLTKIVQALVQQMSGEGINKTNNAGETALSLSLAIVDNNKQSLLFARLVKEKIIIEFANYAIEKNLFHKASTEHLCKSISNEIKALIPDLSNIVGEYIGITNVIEAIVAINSYLVKIGEPKNGNYEEIFEEIFKFVQSQN